MDDFQFLLLVLVELGLFEILRVKDSEFLDIARNYLFSMFRELLTIDDDLNQTNCEECNHEVGEIWVLINEIHEG